MTANDFYDPFYLRGGFRYALVKEQQFIRNRESGDRVIEIGAGMGHHSELLRREGLKVTAVEASQTGTAEAAGLYPQLDVVCSDVAEYEPAEQGHVLARGMSWYHYELGDVNSRGVDVPKQTKRVFDRYMAEGHRFVLQIVTDLSGTRPERKVHNNRVRDYLNLFERFGGVKVYDWAGQSLNTKSHRAYRGVIVVTQKGTA